MVTAYAKALSELMSEGMSEEEAFKKLVTHLKASGRMKILPQLLRELKTEQKRQSSREPLLEVASQDEVKTAEAAVGTDSTATTVVNPSLIHGWRLVTHDSLTDRSGKRALLDLYRKITN